MTPMKKIAHIFIYILACLSIPIISVKAQHPKTYTIKQGDTYYSIARALKIDPNKLIETNKSKALFPGGILDIPSASLKEDVLITHTVKSKETLFKIAKSYNTTIGDIKDINHIPNNTIKVGQVLKIKYGSASNNRAQNINDKEAVSNIDNTPGNDITKTNVQDTINIQRNITTIKTDTNTIKLANIRDQNSVLQHTPSNTDNRNKNDANTSDIAKSTTNNLGKNSNKITDASGLNNPYKPQNNSSSKGIVQQQGVGTWLKDEDLNFSKSVALHNQAPIGTIVKVTNPMNRRSIYAKIIGKFTENDSNKGAIIIISQSAATLLGVLDNRFRINIEYTGN